MNNIHPSQRGYFAHELYKLMKSNPEVYLLTADLGYKMFDQIFQEFPDRAINVGASEQTMMDMAVGLALHHKKVFTYTITPFYTRAYETIRNYINHEKLDVVMVGSGKGKDYTHDGISHWADDIESIMECFSNVSEYYASSKEDVSRIVQEVAQLETPVFICLSR